MSAKVYDFVDHYIKKLEMEQQERMPSGVVWACGHCENDTWHITPEGHECAECGEFAEFD